MENNPENKGKTSSLDHCLRPLLSWLKWTGDERMIFESLPHLMSIQTVENFCWVMKNLGYTSKSISLNLRYVDDRLFPCLFIPKEGGAPKILLEKVGEDISAFDGEDNKKTLLRDLDTYGTVVSFKKQTENILKEDQQHWFKNILLQEKKLLFFVSLLTLIQTLLFIMSPVYIILVYDKVIAANSKGMLLSFFIGVSFALISLAVILSLRTRLLAYIGTHIQKNIGIAIFKKLLKLAPAFTENASVVSQIIRLNDFNVVRDFFSGSLFGTVIEIPFLIIYFLLVWFIGGILVIVPLLTLILSVFVSYGAWRFSQKSVRQNTQVRGNYQDFLLEALCGMRSLQYAGLQKKWMERFREISATSSVYGKDILFNNTADDAAFDAVTLLSGLATLILGTYLVINNQLDLGALIGTMFIIWRILAPIKTLNTMLPKLIQLKLSTRQINELMRLPTELPAERQWKNTPEHIVGSISFTQVTFRYPGGDTPALKNINFSLTPGQTLVIIGPSASGKSTLANLILAMYSPQIGDIFVDGRNIKQFDVTLLRKNIAYVPQKAELFYGTVEQNLLLAQPLASREQMIEAARSAHLLKDIETLPDGFNTHIKFYDDDKLGASFCQKINLARAYLRDAPILVMDEPTSTLDADSIDAFINYLAKIKGKKSIIIFGHNTKHIHLANSAIILYDGYIVTSGDPETVLKNIPAGII